MPRAINRIPLTKEERLFIRKQANNSTLPAAKKLRYQIILKLAQGKGVQTTAELLGTSAQTVSSWNIRFKESGLSGLEDKKGRGRKKSISNAIRKKVIKALFPADSKKRPPSMRSLAKKFKISLWSIQCIRAEHLENTNASSSHEKESNSNKASLIKSKKSASRVLPFSIDSIEIDPNKTYTTINQIAQLAGVSPSTASRALRSNNSDNPRYQQIQAIARKVGYRTNPYVRSLMANIRSNRSIPQHAAIAFINFRAYEKAWKAFPGNQKALDGATMQAERHGFTINEFWPLEQRLSHARLAKILRSRNIEGCIFNAAGFLPPWEWQEVAKHFQDFAIVALGTTQQNPTPHYAINSHFQSFQLAYKKLTDLGYQRIGLCTAKLDERLHNYRMYPGFFQKDSKGIIPIFHTDRVKWHHPKNLKALKKWLTENKIDAVFATNEYVENCFNALKIRMPEDIGFAYNLVESKYSKLSGIRQHRVRIGQAAVDLLVNQINLNEKGFPEVPTGIQFQSEWVDGESTRRVKKHSRKTSS